MTVHVFLGPTLGLEQARELLSEAVYLPPAQAGDVRRLVEQGTEAIGIVDGLYEQVPSVWHKEILFALSRGVWVYGAASMGALRAAELAPFGMVAVGRVAQAFADGTLEDDDEVAVNHATAEHHFRPLSEAMVNLRAGLRLARDLSVISERTHDALLTAAKERFYADRSWPAVLADGRALGLPEAELAGLSRLVAEVRPNQKRDDALELLARIREDRARAPGPFVPAFRFEPTAFWRAGEGPGRWKNGPPWAGGGQ